MKKWEHHKVLLALRILLEMVGIFNMIVSHVFNIYDNMALKTKNKTKQNNTKTKINSWEKQKSIVGRMVISILNISIKNIMRSQLSYKAFNSPISLMSIYVSTFLEKKNDHRGGFVGHFHFF